MFVTRSRSITAIASSGSNLPGGINTSFPPDA